MNQFEEQLLRLKLALGVSKDAEVAAALGMSRAAFSNRKQTGSFPEVRLVLLKRSRPDLDLMFVLTGERWSAGDRAGHDLFFESAAERGDSALAKSAARGARNHVQALKEAASDPQVRELLGLLIFCDRDAIEQVVRVAARVMGRKPLPFDKREPPAQRLFSAQPAALAGAIPAGVEVNLSAGAGKSAATADMIASRPEGAKALIVKAAEAPSPAKPKAARKRALKAATK